MVFYWLFYKAVLQKDTGDANLAYIGINLHENVAPGGDSHMKQTGMLVRNFEFNP